MINFPWDKMKSQPFIIVNIVSTLSNKIVLLMNIFPTHSSEMYYGKGQ